MTAACGSPTASSPTNAGRLSARPRVPARSVTSGIHALGLSGSGRDGLLFVPTSYGPTLPIPLIVLLHGAGGSASNMLAPMLSLADSLGMALLAPDSRSSTWDAIWPGFGPDVAFIDAALSAVFNVVRIDAARVRLAGFSDGASYALGLGRVNGDLFTKIVAWSPISFPKGTAHGRPAFFITQGIHDDPVMRERTRADFVPSLTASGLAVDYREFDGAHEIPGDLRQAAAEWMWAP